MSGSLLARSIVLAAGLLIGCSKEKILQEKRLEAPSESSARNVAAQVEPIVSCPEDKIRNPRPQAPHYRGQCLEGAAYFKGDSQQPGIYMGYKGEDEPVAAVKVTDTGLRHITHGGQALPLYDVTTLDGQRNFCEGEVYDATPEEIQAQCPQGGNDCSYFAKLKNKAVLIPGYWSSATWNPSATSYTLSCFSGVLAKCMHWGYMPGVNHQNDPTKPLTPYFQACVLASRARYEAAVQDPSYTCAGTKIDIYDNLGIQRKKVQDFSFESLWSKDGLVCLRRPRYKHCDTLQVSPACTDPVSDVNQDWTGGQGLIAVSSSDGYDIGQCPNTLNSCKASSP